MHSIPVNGAHLVAETTGHGEPFVLLHGLGDDRRTWDPIASVFSPERMVVRYDLRGYGESVEPGAVPFRHAQDLRVVLDTLGIDRCDLMGVSMGGSVALNFSLDFPERVRRLVLISPGLVGWEWSDEWRALWTQITAAARNTGIAEARELWWNHPLFATTRQHSAASDSLRRGILNYSGKHWLHDNEEPAYPDLDRLHALSMPTLLLTGTQDLADFRLIADLIEAAAVQVSRIDVDGAGHLVYLEYPEIVVSAVRRFLADAAPS